MSWSYNVTTGELKKISAGGTREVWRFTRRTSGSGTMSLQVPNITHHVRVLLFSDEDCKTGWEIGIMTDGGCLETKASIRRISDGVPEVAPVASVTHNVPVGRTYTQTIDFTPESLKVTIHGGTGGPPSPSVTWANTVPPTYAGRDRFGIVSEVLNAAVQQMSMRDLTAKILTASKTKLAFSGGSVYAQPAGGSWAALGLGILPTTDFVSAVEYQGKVYAVAGQKCVEIDVVQRTVVPFTATFGSVPGATSPGTTTGTQFFVYGAFLGMIAGNDRELHFAAAGDPKDWLPDPFLVGSAFVLGAGTSSFRFGERILGVQPTTLGGLLVLCERSAFVIYGNPADENIQQVPESLDVGCVGVRAFAASDLGRTLVLSHGGLYVFPAVGKPVPISADVLALYINTPPGEESKYNSIVLRDPTNSLLYIFRTLVNQPSGYTSTHIVYDESEGGYRSRNGGFLPDAYPNRCGPCSAAVFDGVVHLGGRDGHLYRFKQGSLTGTDDGVPMDHWTTLSPTMDMAGLAQGISLTYFDMDLAEGSTPVNATFMVGRNAEQAMSFARRTVLHSSQFSPGSSAVTPEVSAPAIAVQIKGVDLTRWWAIEEISVVLDSNFLSDGTGFSIPTRHAPCAKNWDPTQQGAQAPEDGPGSGDEPEDDGGLPCPIRNDAEGGGDYDPVPVPDDTEAGCYGTTPDSPDYTPSPSGVTVTKVKVVPDATP